jgi:diadenosine tetraphosphate (Ap4A) HIT family hydrolase
VKQFEIRTIGSESETFQHFLTKSDDAHIIDKFRTVCKELDDMNLIDYHFKVSNRYDYDLRRSLPGWDISVSYRVYAEGSTELKGPLQVSRCMSCDLDCPLELGVVGDGELDASGPRARDSLIFQGDHVRAWIDAKGRPMLIVTPIRHRERLSDLDDAELPALWRTALEQMSRLGLCHFNAMAVNHGRNRNHEHLHLKVKLRGWEFDRAVQRGDPDVRRRLDAIRAFATRRLGRRAENNFHEPPDHRPRR